VVRRVLAMVVLLTGTLTAQSDRPIVSPVVRTAPLVSYEDAPATPDADDPAIWVNRRDFKRALVIGTAKDAGLLVFDLSGRLVQALFPPNAPQCSTPTHRRPPVSTPLSTIHVPRAKVARRSAATTTSTLLTT
jgi:3-phytase